MKTPRLRHTCLVGIVLMLALAAGGATMRVKDLPEAEQQLADTVDPWGLTFADQLTRFQSHFTTASSPDYVVGFARDLVKIFPNKYWFRGDIVSSEVPQPPLEPLWGVTGGAVSFQIAVLPRTGAPAASYTVQAQSERGWPVTVWREEYVYTGQACYPRLESEYWPDPLVPDNHCELSGTEAGVFLCEVTIPPGFRGGNTACRVTVTKEDGEETTFRVPVEVVPLEIHPKRYPLVAWFGQDNLTEEQFRAMLAMVLSNHLQPFLGSDLARRWKSGGPDAFGDLVEFLLARGQTLFGLRPTTVEVYEYIKQKGWLPKFVVKGIGDEPPEDYFLEKSIPYAKEMRETMPGLRIYQATEAHPRLAEGVDILMTDISSAKYDPRTFQCPPGVTLWHYYCHLPINWQMRAPLVYAPNMEIDNDALQHRLALWMSWYYGAEAVFIWAGNREWKALGDDFWSKREVQTKVNAGYPYGGTHHGNGFLVYPPREPGGQVLPSLRLKILRDGVEDIAIFRAIEQKFGERAEAWITPVPDVFQHPHYYDRLPAALLKKRSEILQTVRERMKTSDEGVLP